MISTLFDYNPNTNEKIHKAKFNIYVIFCVGLVENWKSEGAYRDQS